MYTIVSTVVLVQQHYHLIPIHLLDQLQQQGYFTRLLVETMYQDSNEGVTIIYVVHSMGGPVSLYFLTLLSARNRKISTFTPTFPSLQHMLGHLVPWRRYYSETMSSRMLLEDRDRWQPHNHLQVQLGYLVPYLCGNTITSLHCWRLSDHLWRCRIQEWVPDVPGYCQY